MYTPSKFKITDKRRLISFIKSHSFGMMVNNGSQYPKVSHLPFIVDETGEDVKLVGHLSRQNSQSSNLDGERLLIVFQGENSYISANWYVEPARNVPTWNYIVVHATGIARTIIDPDEIELYLEELSRVYEKSFKDQWSPKSIPRNLLSGLSNGIVCFEVKLEELLGCFKLSQNKSDHDIVKVGNHLIKSKDHSDNAIGRLMLDELNKVKNDRQE